MRSTAAVIEPARSTWLFLMRNMSYSPMRWFSSAAATHRVFVERAQPRRGLARVVDPRLRPAHGVDVAPRGRGDARGALHEIERRPLPRQQRDDARR